MTSDAPVQLGALKTVDDVSGVDLNALRAAALNSKKKQLVASTTDQAASEKEEGEISDDEIDVKIPDNQQHFMEALHIVKELTELGVEPSEFLGYGVSESTLLATYNTLGIALPKVLHEVTTPKIWSPREVLASPLPLTTNTPVVNPTVNGLIKTATNHSPKSDESMSTQGPPLKRIRLNGPQRIVIDVSESESDASEDDEKPKSRIFGSVRKVDQSEVDQFLAETLKAHRQLYFTPRSSENNSEDDTSRNTAKQKLLEKEAEIKRIKERIAQMEKTRKQGAPNNNKPSPKDNVQIQDAILPKSNSVKSVVDEDLYKLRSPLPCEDSLEQTKIDQREDPVKAAELDGDHIDLNQKQMFYGFCHFKPYISPLRNFRSCRLHEKYVQLYAPYNGWRSLTYNHQIDPKKMLCRYEAAGGRCNDDGCKGSHFADWPLVKPSGENNESGKGNLIKDMMSYVEGETKEERQEYTNQLEAYLKNRRERKEYASRWHDIDTCISICEFRNRVWIKDPTRVLCWYRNEMDNQLLSPPSEDEKDLQSLSDDSDQDISMDKLSQDKESISINQV